jgi:hypothetical protein
MHAAAVIAAVVVAVVLPLSGVLAPNVDRRPSPPVTDHGVERIIPPRPDRAPILGVAQPAGPAVGGQNSAPAAGPGVQPASGPEGPVQAVVSMFSDKAADVKNNTGLDVSEPSIDLWSGRAIYDHDSLTFAMEVADLSAIPSSDDVQTWIMRFRFNGVAMELDACRGAICAEYPFGFYVDNGRSSISVAVAGRLDEATDTIFGTISLGELNDAIRRASASAGSVAVGSWFQDVFADAESSKQIGEGQGAMGELRSAYDHAGVAAY